jgi:hypothetical protein
MYTCATRFNTQFDVILSAEFDNPAGSEKALCSMINSLADIGGVLWLYENFCKSIYSTVEDDSRLFESERQSCFDPKPTLPHPVSTLALPSLQHRPPTHVLIVRGRRWVSYWDVKLVLCLRYEDR